MVLHEKKISFETREEDLAHLSEALRSLHPEKKVPLLLHGPLVLYESAIITEYLEDFAPEPRLMPEGAAGKASVRLLTYWCNQTLKPQVDRVKYGTSRFLETECEGAEEKLAQSLAELEGKLAESDWLVENRFSLADIHLFPFIRQIARAKPPILQPFPRILGWVEKIQSRESFKKALA
jgi:glutathione S-transferase